MSTSKTNKVKATLNEMMKAGKAELARTSSPELAWEAAKNSNSLPPTLWDRYINLAMTIDFWYAMAA